MLPISFLTMLICGIGNQASSSVRDQYKTMNSCSYETATFENIRTGFYMNGAYSKDIDRLCITQNNYVINYTRYYNPRYEKGERWSQIYESTLGKLGESKSYQYGSYLTGYSNHIDEILIEGNELVRYSCETKNGSECSGSVSREILGTKF